ncbi:unnamed protein product [Symbiodinium natans]|uniref:Uncharacterized protein n=1 Tax=Symbiodinium natans TaxID=878477 RepID=A0A812PNK7_9DINO|nr:unnamed protein product [Symbiodinium natans]
MSRPGAASAQVQIEVQPPTSSTCPCSSLTRSGSMPASLAQARRHRTPWTQGRRNDYGSHLGIVLPKRLAEDAEEAKELRTLRSHPLPVGRACAPGLWDTLIRSLSLRAPLEKRHLANARQNGSESCPAGANLPAGPAPALPVEAEKSDRQATSEVQSSKSRKGASEPSRRLLPIRPKCPEALASKVSIAFERVCSEAAGITASPSSDAYDLTSRRLKRQRHRRPRFRGLSSWQLQGRNSSGRHVL